MNDNDHRVSDEILYWINMMKYMLELAQMSTAVAGFVRNKPDFSDNDVKNFNKLCLAVDEIRNQLGVLSGNAKKSKIHSTQSSKVKTRNVFIQTYDENVLENVFQETRIVEETKKETRKHALHRAACFCDRFMKKLLERNKNNRITVCSTMIRSRFSNDKCNQCGGCLKLNQGATEETGMKSGYKMNSEDWPNDDNHPYIIKDPGEIIIPETGVGYELFTAMRRYPNIIAQYVEITDEVQTYAELLRDCTSVAIKLRSKGLNEEDIICVCVTGTKNACIPYLGGLFVGCQMNGLDMSFHIPDIAFLLNLATPKLIFVQNEKVSDVEEALQQVGKKVDIVVIGGEIEGYESLEDYLKASDEEIKKFKPYKVDSLSRTCIILFSSGTSGLPKAICLTHRNVINQFVTSVLPGNMKKIFLTFNLFYWISSVVCLGVAILAGITRVVALPFEASRVHKLIMKYKIGTIFFGPYECMMLLKTPKPPNVDTSSLKVVVTGGSGLKDTVIYGLRELFPGSLVFQTYGQTETGGLIIMWSTDNPKEVALMNAKPDSSGIPYSGFWYKIVEEDTEKILGPYQRGELYVKSNNMLMKGYYKMDSSDCFDKLGWLKTGDMAYYDDYHCFFIVDRMKELIKFRGWHVPPTILEHLLSSHRAVARAVVVGIPDDEDGEHPMGFVILHDGIDPNTVDVNEIAAFVNEQVEDRKRLRGGVKIIKNIPITATGKVRRRALRDAYIRGEEL
ncbi:hypothetical protein HHI36_008502 [Cryptolaemus montrouzieri]|uniref:Luciferin 4-monooxygenase n=1 Tax=Cryptolaemus montrouzieri TaxID=559131 RepID=A0ABD2MSZ7_9CUCU